MIAFLKDPRALALLCAATLTILSNTVISPALPGLEASFPDDPNAAFLTRLLVTAPSLMVALTAGLAGLAADRWGRRPLLLTGVTLYAVAGCAGLVLPDLTGILLSRLALGVALAMVMTAQAALIGDYFAGRARDRFMGFQIGAVNFGGFAFIALAGWLAGLSPRAPFLIYAAGALILPFLWLVIRDVPRSPQPAPRAASPAAAPGDPRWRGTLAAVTLLSGLGFVLFYLMPTQIPFYLVSLGHDAPAVAAQVLAMVMLSGGVVGLAFGPIRARLGRGITPALGFLAMAAGFATLEAGEAVPLIAVAALLVGTGFGLVMPTFFSLALEIAPPERRGFASGALTTAIFLGQFLSPILATPLIAAQGYGTGFAVAAILLVVMAGVVFALFHRRAAPAPLAEST
ncbi:MFS transporter [Roseivivax sp. CAU 1761]